MNDDVFTLLNTIRASRDAEARLNEYKAVLKGLVVGKLEEIREYLTKLGPELEEMAEIATDLFIPGLKASVYSSESPRLVGMAFDTFRVTFEPFSDSVMVAVHDGDIRRSNDMTPPDRITEAWVREVVLRRLRAHYKADMLEGSAPRA